MDVSNVISRIKIKQFTSNCLNEEQASFDIGSFIFGDDESTAEIIINEIGVVAGISFVNAVYSEMGCKIKWNVKDGDRITTAPSTLAVVSGPRKEIFRGERLALLILSKASSIASTCKKLLDRISTISWKGTLAGTIKTTPGFDLVEKYAMIVGGVETNRYDLSSMIILNENHKYTCGNLTKAVKIAKQLNKSTKVAAICNNQEEALEASSADVNIIILEGCSSKEVLAISKVVKTDFPKILIEVRGNINELTIASFALPQVDIIGCSNLCDNYAALNMSLLLKDQADIAIKTNGSSPSAEPSVLKIMKKPLSTVKSPPTPPVPIVRTPIKRAVSSSGTATTPSTTGSTQGRQDSGANKKPRVEAPPKPAPPAPRRTPYQDNSRRPSGNPMNTSFRHNKPWSNGNQQMNQRRFGHPHRPQLAITAPPNMRPGILGEALGGSRGMGPNHGNRPPPMPIRPPQSNPRMSDGGDYQVAAAGLVRMVANNLGIPFNGRPQRPPYHHQGDMMLPRPGQPRLMNPAGFNQQRMHGVRAPSSFCQTCGEHNFPGAQQCNSCGRRL